MTNTPLSATATNDHQTPLRGLSLEDAAAHLVKKDPQFALGEATIRGVTYPVFTNAPKTVPDLLKHVRAAHGDGADDYLVFGDERWTFDEFSKAVGTLAAALQSQFSVQPGTRVALAMRNLPEMLILMMAVSAAGGVIVFLNGWWTTEELDYALKDSDAKLVLADAQRLARLRPLEGPLDLTLVGVRDATGQTVPDYYGLAGAHLSDQGANIDWQPATIDTDDDFAIMYSSGTTGHPKGVVQTHRGAVSAVYSWHCANHCLPLMAPADVELPAPVKQACLIVTPLFHVTATHPMFLLSLPMGAKIVLMGKWNAEEAAQIIDREQITRFLGVPTQSAELKVAAQELGTTLPSLQFLGSGGAKRPAAQVDELQEAFPHSSVASGWGMTETNAVGLGIGGPDYVARPGAAGRLYPPIQALKILDDDGAEMPNGAVGELTVKSAANMRCYLNQPKATAEVLADGWLRTGDLAMVDDEGYVTIVDRKKNIIIRGGENIACLDVEGALHRHPAVLEAGVFSVPDERLGEVVGAGVQLKPGETAKAEELSAFLMDYIAKFKIPEHYWIGHDPLPRGATDKTDRRALRAKCLSKDAALF
ncbi:MAG: AMP-binding protein [Pseudomonadota bacterium]